MAFGQNKERPNVNTDAFTLKNSDAAHQSALNVGYWNGLVSIKINPALEKSQQTEMNVFNWEKNTSTAITVEKVITVADCIEQFIIPAIKEGRQIFKGVPVGENGLIGVGVDTSGGNPEAYFAIYKSLDENTRVPASWDKYIFKATYTVDDYNPTTGELNVTHGIQSEIALFLNMLRASVIGLSNATVHADRHVNRAFRERLTGQIDEVAVKLGLASKKTGGSNGGGSYNRNGRSGSVFTGAPSTGANANLPERSFNDTEVPVRRGEGIDDLDSYI